MNVNSRSQSVLDAIQRTKQQRGMDGDPIWLNDERYRDYLNQVRRRIRDKWAYPCVYDRGSGRCDYRSASVIVVFGLLKDGRIASLMVAESAAGPPGPNPGRPGYEIYDEYAVNALKLASPFPPVPDAMLNGHAGVPVVGTFTYCGEMKPEKP